MYGVINEVTIAAGRADEAEKMLHDQIIPLVKTAPGFVAGYWLRSDDGTAGMSILLFESEDAARKAVEHRPLPPEDAPVSQTRMEIRRVLAQA